MCLSYLLGHYLLKTFKKTCKICKTATYSTCSSYRDDNSHSILLKLITACGCAIGILHVYFVVCILHGISPLVSPSSARIRGSIQVRYTSTLSLICSAYGIVDNYKWYRNSSLLTTTTTNRYIKSSAQLSDSGSYQCEACNWAGCSSTIRTVTVRGLFM